MEKERELVRRADVDARSTALPVTP